MITDREVELRRLKDLRHFELLAEVLAHIPPQALGDPWHAARYAGMSRDSLITLLLPPLHGVRAVAA